MPHSTPSTLCVACSAAQHPLRMPISNPAEEPEDGLLRDHRLVCPQPAADGYPHGAGGGGRGRAGPGAALGTGLGWDRVPRGFLHRAGDPPRDGMSAGEVETCHIGQCFCSESRFWGIGVPRNVPSPRRSVWISNRRVPAVRARCRNVPLEHQPAALEAPPHGRKSSANSLDGTAETLCSRFSARANSFAFTDPDSVDTQERGNARCPDSTNSPHQGPHSRQ